MDAILARELLERLGCRKIKEPYGEIMASCPFGDNHKRGDRRPSFSAAINPDDASPYICFGCHATGTLEGLACHTGNKDLVPDDSFRDVKPKPWLFLKANNVAKFGHLYDEKKKPVLFKDVYLDLFIRMLPGYLKKRGLKLETAKAWEICFDRENRRAIFVMRDIGGRLAAVVGRDVTGNAWVKYSNYVLDRKNKRMVPGIDHDREEDFISPTKSLFLYGEHMAWKVCQGEDLSRKNMDLIVVEGALDALMLWQRGFNVVAILGSYPSDAQVEKLVMMTPRDARLVIMADGDDAGRKMTENLGGKTGSRVPTLDAVLPDGVDPGEATDEQIDDALRQATMFGLT